MAETPDELRYTEDHEWARRDGEHVRIGITDYAQEQLGDIVYVDLPGPGTELEQGQPFGEVESTKSVSDLFAPVSGIIEERNDDLDEQPELVNGDPYGDGWMLLLTLSDPDDLDGLLDADAYRALTE